VTSRTVAVADVVAPEVDDEGMTALLALPDDAPFRCASTEVCARMAAAVDAARQAGDSVGGVFEVLARGLPPGLGSHVHWDRRLDARLGGASSPFPR
jgi:chorismate synthase